MGEPRVRCTACGHDFHAACVGAAGDARRWTCAACAVGAARCSVCQVYQPVEEAIKCTAPGCARIRCGACGAGDEWTCGAHACGACGRVLDERDDTAVRCVRCPRGFCRQCRPASAAPVATNAFRCVAHVREVRAPLDVRALRRVRGRLRVAAEPTDGADEFTGAEFSSDEEAPAYAARTDMAAARGEISSFSPEGAVASAAPIARLPRKRRRAPSPPVDQGAPHQGPDTKMQPRAAGRRRRSGGRGRGRAAPPYDGPMMMGPPHGGPMMMGPPYGGPMMGPPYGGPMMGPPPGAYPPPQYPPMGYPPPQQMPRPPAAPQPGDSLASLLGGALAHRNAFAPPPVLAPIRSPPPRRPPPRPPAPPPAAPPEDPDAAFRVLEMLEAQGLC